MTKERDEWGSRVQFLLTCVGHAVGLGNVWRFPATASQHGKGAFFIPYIICAIVIGFPVMFFEMSIGQFYSLSANRLFSKYVTIFRGLGFSMAILNTIIGITYNTVIAWCLMYTFYSIFFPMRIWTECSNDWNNPCCSTNSSFIPEDCFSTASETPTKQFFFNQILKKSDFINDFTSFNWRMALAIFASAMGCALITVTGTRSMGKAAYITATVPYFLILALLANSLFVSNGLAGIASSLIPEFSHVMKKATWYKAGGQVCYSLSLGASNLIALSSCNKKNYNCYADCFVLSIADFGMSLLGSLTIFSVMGITSFENNSSSTKPIAEGTSLAFVIYPEAVMLMPFAKLWSILFFITLVLLGVGSFGSIFLSCTTMIIDQWPTMSKHRQFVVFGQAFFYFACGCFFCTPDGFYYFNILNEYGPGFAVLLLVFLELICCIHIYGYSNFQENLFTMFGYPKNCVEKVFSPSGWYLKLMWLVVSPAAVFALFVAAFYNHMVQPAGYSNTDYPFYPAPVQIVVWIFLLITLAPLLTAGIWEIYQAIKHKRGLRSLWQKKGASANSNRIYVIPHKIATPPAFKMIKPANAWTSTETQQPSKNHPHTVGQLLRESRPTHFQKNSYVPRNRHIPFKSTLL